MTHEAKLLEVGFQSANIDLGIYDLVREIWLSGIETRNSCEDGDDGTEPERDVWLQFKMCSDYNKFMWICFTKLDLSECESFIVEIVPDAMHDDLASILEGDEWGSFIERPLEIPHTISVRFPGRLQETIEKAFVNYRTQKENGDISHLLSVYDEGMSGKVLSGYFGLLLEFLYGDPFIKISDVDRNYVLELFCEIAHVVRFLSVDLMIDPNTKKIITVIPKVKEFWKSVYQQKVNFDTERKNPRIFFQTVAKGNEAEQKSSMSVSGDIDASSDNLVQEIMLNGIKATHSCESNRDSSDPEREVCLVFRTCSDFNKFMWISFTRLSSSEFKKFALEIVADAIREDLILLRDIDVAEYGCVPLLSQMRSSISARFPAMLQKNMVDAFVHYRTGDITQLSSEYDEKKSGLMLSGSFLRLFGMLFRDLFIKLSDMDRHYMVELFDAIMDKIKDLRLGLNLDPNSKKVIAEIPSVGKVFDSVVQAKVNFVATHKNPSAFFQPVAESKGSEQKRPKVDGSGLDKSGPK